MAICVMVVFSERYFILLCIHSRKGVCTSLTARDDTVWLTILCYPLVRFLLESIIIRQVARTNDTKMDRVLRWFQ